MRKVYAIIALVVALAGAGLVANKLWTKSLTEQASKTQAAINTANAFQRIAEMAAKQAQKERAAAQLSEKKARSWEAAAISAADHADSLLAFAPDTCRPYIEAQKDVTAKVQSALDEQKQATARLLGAAAGDSTANAALSAGLGTVTDAAQDLVNSTHRSWILNILPKPGISVTAGVTPQGKFAIVGGVSLGWNF